MITNAEALMKPLRIENVVTRNRVMSTSHGPGVGDDFVVDTRMAGDEMRTQSTCPTCPFPSRRS